MLQTACMSPELLVNQNSENETCGYSPSQGSPLPGETASPKSYFQQSPSLPDSGLTEFNVASPKIHPPSRKPREMSAPTDSGLSSDPPQKRYMGVRVKMPVRELLRKIRLSKGLDPAHSKEASLTKTVTKGSSGKTEKRRVHPYTEKQLRQVCITPSAPRCQPPQALLHKAVAQGRRALTYALAQRFASLNKINEKDAEERTALHLAAEKNQHLMVSDLISLGANVNEQDSLGKTPLHLCAENGYLRVLEVLKNCKTNGVYVEVNLTDHYGLTPLHCAALAHTVLVTESQKADINTDTGRFLRLRKDQILEGINCLLQMGGKPEVQVLNSHQVTTTCLKIEENTELMCLLQTHKPKGENILQESYSLLDAPRRTPSPSSPDNFAELFPVSSSDLLDVILKGKC
ncbi:ankyrin-3-like [Athene cunicularia]|uniref:ankyrin-3-like n=1 Tax=Athene cunicularia TaxID=194338 RepID=UPI000EF73963|nr:ankyrin-3-like [Athene cunicularia]